MLDFSITLSQSTGLPSFLSGTAAIIIPKKIFMNAIEKPNLKVNGNIGKCLYPGFHNISERG